MLTELASLNPQKKPNPKKSGLNSTSETAKQRKEPNPKKSGLSSTSEILENVLPFQPNHDQTLDAMEMERLYSMLRTLGIPWAVDKEEVHRNAFDIERAFEAHQKCLNCPHDPQTMLSCYPLHISCEADGKLHPFVAACPYAKHAQAAKAYEKALQDMMIAPRFQNRTLQNFKPSPLTKKIYAFCLEWAENFSSDAKGIYIFGSYGSGKTHLAVGLLLAIQEKYHIHGYFIVLSTFFRTLRNSFGDSEKLQEQFDFVKKAPLLVLDDFGEGRKEANGQLSSWALEQLFSLINYRYEHLLPTIITSHFDPEALEKVVGYAIVSRLVSMCTFLHNREHDHRMKELQIID